MSIKLKYILNGLECSFLKNSTHMTFDECIAHNSFRLDNPKKQKKLVIHKYIPLRYLLVMLKEKKMILRKVESWEDPYENFFLKQKFVKPNSCESSSYDSLEGLAKGLYGMSWTSQDETDSLWRIYSPDKMSVRISTTVEKLCEIVGSEDDKWDVWIGPVTYKTDKELKSWLLQCKSIYNCDSFIEKICQSFFIKRREFSAEHEYRLVVNYDKENRPGLCFQCLPETFITSYLIDPRVNQYEFDAIRACLVSVGVKEERISKSDLYYFQPQRIEMPYEPFYDF